MEMKARYFFKELNKQKAGYLFILPQFVLFFALMIWPIINGFRLSLYKITFKGYSFIGFDNYRRLMSDEFFRRAIVNTIVFVIAIVTLSVVIGVVISAAVFDKKPAFVSFIRGAYYIPVAVSMAVMAVTWSFLFSTANGLINYIITYFGGPRINWLGDSKLVMPIIIFVTFVSNVGQVIVLYIAAMIGIPVDLLEAADVDGVSPWQRFRHIILPLVRPTTVYVLITQTIAVVKIYVVIQLLTNGGPNHASVTLMYYLYEKAFINLNRMGEAAAIGVIMFFICVVLSIMMVFITQGKRRR